LCVYRKKCDAGNLDGGTSRRVDDDRLLESRATGWRQLRLQRPQPLPLRGDGDGRRNRRRNHSKLSIFKNHKNPESNYYTTLL
jgi:hypothetical protein